MKKVKILQFLLFILGLSITAVFTQGATAGANCSTRDGDDTCIQANCDAAKKAFSNLTNDECYKAIKECQGTSEILRAGTEQGNCSNALRSCFENLSESSTKKQACLDDGVLANATRCNNGNVNAGSTGMQGCGINDAINERNASSGGEDYDNNIGIKQRRIDEQIKAACDGRNYTKSVRDTCENNIRKSLDQCYSQNGDTSKAINNDTFDNCMASKANSSNECDAVKGKWDSNTKKCTPPAASDGKTCDDGSRPGADGKCADGSTATKKDGTGTSARAKTDGEAGTCGKARTNIIACGDEGGMAALGSVLKIALFVLTVIVGIAATGGIAYSAVLYAGAQDNAGDTQKAKEMIRNIVIGLIAYGLMVAIIQWLVPGMSIS